MMWRTREPEARDCRFDRQHDADIVCFDFTASANTFRATGLSEVNVAANEVLNRNLIYRHGRSR